MSPKLLLVAALAAAPVVVAAEGAVTVYGGYRGGGGFVDATTGRSIDLRESASVAASVDFPIDASREVQIFVAHQRSEFEAGVPPGSPAAGLNGQSVSVTYFHLGGTNFFDGQIGRGPYVVGGLGATLFSPGTSGYSSEWRPSMSIGIGYQWTLGERLALRFEARGYVTLVNSEGGLFCSGGCVITVEGDTFTQGEAQIGLSLRF
ncbi:MAG: hypothetical protein EHM83_07860 [Burkholderiales bacterium]|nr:MAG: hypothetical protein EHM83_07860 [Burkholderiales bacterium]